MRGAAIAACLLVISPLAAQQRDTIDGIVREEIESQRLTGVAVAVIRGGDVLKAAGYGFANVEHRVNVTTASSAAR
jgi:CubicO group peptidase (beta-lactamase class C family)